MRMKSTVIIGFLSLMISTGVASASDLAVIGTQRADDIERIGAGGSTHAFSWPDGAGVCPVAGADAAERIGHGGSTYSLSRSETARTSACHAVREEWKKEKVVARIGAGGSVYSSNSTMSN